MRMKGVVIAVMKPMNVLKITVTALLCFGAVSTFSLAANVTVTTENFEGYNLFTVNAYQATTVNYPGYAPATIAAGQGTVINAPGGTVYTEREKQYEGNAAENILSYAKTGDNEVLALPGGLNNGWRGRYSNPMTLINGQGGADAAIRWSKRRLAVVKDGENQALKLNPSENGYVSTWSDYAYENVDFTKPLIWKSDVKIEKTAPNGELVIGIGKGSIAPAAVLTAASYRAGRESTEDIIVFRSDNSVLIGSETFEYEYGRYYTVTVVAGGAGNTISVTLTDKESDTVIAELTGVTTETELADDINVYYTAKSVIGEKEETSVLIDNLEITSIDFEAKYSSDSEIRTDGTGFCIIDFSDIFDAESVSSDTVKLFCGDEEVGGTSVSAESSTRIKLLLPELDESKKYTVRIDGVKNSIGIPLKCELKIKMPGEVFGAEIDEMSDILADGTGSCVIVFTDELDAESVNSDSVRLFDGETELSVKDISLIDEFRVKIGLPELEQAKVYRILLSGIRNTAGDSIESEILFRTARNAEPEQITGEGFESYNLVTVYSEGATTVKYPGYDNTSISAGQGMVINAPGGTIYTEKERQFEGNAAENILSYAKTGDNEVLALPGGLNNGWRGRYSHPMTITNGQGGADSPVRWSQRRLAVVKDGDGQALRLNPAKNGYVDTWSDYAYENIGLSTPILWESSVRADSMESGGSVVMGIGVGAIKAAPPLEYPGYLGGREEVENIISFTPEGMLLIGGENAFEYENGQYYKITVIIDATGENTVCSVVVRDAAGKNTLAQRKFNLKIKHKGTVNVFYTANTAMNAGKETSATVDNIAISKLVFDAVLKSATDAALDGGECVIEFSEPFAEETVNGSTVKVFDEERELDGVTVTADGTNKVRIKLPQVEPSRYYKVKIDGVENLSGLVSSCEVLFRTKDRISDSPAVFDNSGVSVRLKNNTADDCELTVLAVFMKDKKIMNNGVNYRRVTVKAGKNTELVRFDLPDELSDADSVTLCYIDDMGHFTAIAPFRKSVKK